MTPISLSPTAKILAVKLADLGDVLTATPALRALRHRYPAAKIDVLVTHHTQSALKYSGLVNAIIPSDNFRFFSPRDALKPSLFAEAWRLLSQLRHQKYDAVVVLHHLTTRAGAWKYGAIVRASGANVVVGLRSPGKQGRFLTHSIPDMGFGDRHEVAYWLDVVSLLDAKPLGHQMELALSATDIEWAENALPAEGIRYPLVVIHPGSGGFSTARRWQAQKFAAVADVLMEDGATVALVGTPADGTDTVKTCMSNVPLDFTGKTSLHQLAALIAQAQLFIGGDSGVSHIAASTGVPMISIFGPTNAAAWGAHGKHRRVFRAEIPCAPCAYIGHSVGLRNGCEALTCLKLVSAPEVLSAARELLQNDMQEVPTLDFPDPPRKNGTTILGIALDAVTFNDALSNIEALIAEGGQHQICTVNPEFVVMAQHDAMFRRIINRSAMAFADGGGLLKASRWLKKTVLPERVTGVDMVEALARLSGEKGYRLFFLGAQPGVAQRAVTELRRRYPQLNCAGIFAGSPRAGDEDEIVVRIQSARPDILFVAYGAPRQDKWIARNLSRLPAHVSMGVGGAFDFISGTAQRAPVWVQRLGLEWLHRLVMQPWRWRRIWNAVPRFMWLVFKEKIGFGGQYDD